MNANKGIYRLVEALPPKVVLFGTAPWLYDLPQVITPAMRTVPNGFKILVAFLKNNNTTMSGHLGLYMD